MTPRSFFLIVVKVIAIFFLIELFSILAQSASWIALMLSAPNSEQAVLSLLLISIARLLFVLLLHYLLFSTNKVVDKLALDKHFQEEMFQLNIHPSTVIKIATVVVGASFFADALPSLIKYAISYNINFQLGDKRESYSTITWLIFFALKILTGYLLFTNSSRVAAIIEKKRRS